MSPNSVGHIGVAEEEPRSTAITGARATDLRLNALIEQYDANCLQETMPNYLQSIQHSNSNGPLQSGVIVKLPKESQDPSASKAVRSKTRRNEGSTRNTGAKKDCTDGRSECSAAADAVDTIKGAAAAASDSKCGGHPSRKQRRKKATSCVDLASRDARDMELVNASDELCCDSMASIRCLHDVGRLGSPCAHGPASEDEVWEEASDCSSDTDADHSDSSDDDNPTSQVDRLIESSVQLMIDGENSNLSSETEDSSEDELCDELSPHSYGGEHPRYYESDSDITDVSPLVSNAPSPVFGLSPILARRNILPSSASSGLVRPPFLRHYSNTLRDNDGDVSDNGDDDLLDELKLHGSTWCADDSREDLYRHQDMYHHRQQGHGSPHGTPDMSLVVQALFQLGLESKSKRMDAANNNLDRQMSADSASLKIPETCRRLSTAAAALHANPHHHHLRRHSYPRRKNLSFTNEEVRIINRDNSVLLSKILAVNSRANRQQGVSSTSTAVSRRRQDEAIQRDNLAILRRLQEVKPSSDILSASVQHRHHRRHHSSKTRAGGASSSAESCGATARRTAIASHHSSKYSHAPTKGTVS